MLDNVIAALFHIVFVYEICYFVLNVHEIRCCKINVKTMTYWNSNERLRMRFSWKNCKIRISTT